MFIQIPVLTFFSIEVFGKCDWYASEVEWRNGSQLAYLETLPGERDFYSQKYEE